MMKKKNALSSERLKALFPETPPAFTAFVAHNLDYLKAGKETPVMKKKLSLGLALALALTLLLAAVAVAAMLSPTAEVFGFLYGKEKEEALLKGDIATVGQTHAFDDLLVTLEEVVYQAEGNMPGLYGTGIIAPKAGSNVVLVPEDYSVNDPAGYAVHYDMEMNIPDTALSYSELAANHGARMLTMWVRVNNIVIGQQAVEADTGYSLIPQEDGTVRFAFSVSDGQLRRAESYDLSMSVGFRETDAQGMRDDLHRDAWTVRVSPALSATAKAEIAAQTPPAEPAAAPPSAPGIVRVLGYGWSMDEVFLAENPARQIERIQVEYDAEFEHILNPENAWDVAYISLTQGDFSSLVKDGRLLNLSDDPVIAGKIARIHQSIQQAVSQDGNAYALPVGIFGGTYQFGAGRDETWAQLGLSRYLVPKTFAQLCALADTYMAVPLADRKGTSFLNNDSAAASRYTLLDRLVEIRFAEAQAEGGPLTFDTPAFREGLMQIEQAAKALSGKMARPDSNGRRYALINENSNSLTEDDNLYLRLGDNPAYTADITVVVVNANADNKEAALDYVRWLSGNLSGQFLRLLDREMTADELALYTIQNDLASRKATDSEPGDIARMEERLKNGNYADYGPKPETLARYRQEIAPNLVVMTRRLPEAAYYAKDNYLKGKLDADGLIQALDAAVK